MKTWENIFRNRIDGFKTNFPEKNGFALSIKTRVELGCFHREHSPKAYQIIDNYLQSCEQDYFYFEEHESGPEILVYIAAGTAVLTLAKSVIDLVTTIVKARSEGIKKGDSREAPLELIIRGFDDNGKIQEEKILRFTPKDKVDKKIIERALNKGLKKIISKSK